MDELRGAGRDRTHAAPAYALEAGVWSVELCASDDAGYGATYTTLERGTFRRHHETDVIVYLLSGSVRVTSEDGALDLVLAPGEAVYLPRGTQATWVVIDAAHQVVVSRVVGLHAAAS